MIGGSIVEVIKEGEIIRMPESQAVDEDLFILRRLIEPERAPVEYEDIRVPQKRSVVQEDVKSYSRLESWKSGKPAYEVNNVISELKDNFQWHITRKRREQGISRKQLAEAIGVSEEEVKAIELGDLPKDDFVLVSKIENHLGLQIRKEKEKSVSLSDLQKSQEGANKKSAEGPVKQDILGDDIEILD